MAPTERAVTVGGHMLWRSYQDAWRYAEARHLLYGTRQRVSGELVLGVWFWRASKARRQHKVAEPCS